MPLVQTFGNAAARAYGWTRSLGSAAFIATLAYSTASPKRITVDANDNIYLSLQKSTNFNMVFKFPPTGTSMTYQQLGNDASLYQAFALDTDNSGQLLMGLSNNGMGVVGTSGANVLNGFVNNTTNAVYGIQWDGSTGAIMSVATSGPGGSVVMKSNISTGAVIWQRKLVTGTNSEVAQYNGRDSSYNTYNSSYHGGTGLVWVAKYDTNGTIQWQRNLTSSNSIGSFATHISTGDNYSFVNTGTTGAIYKMNASGTYQWGKTFTGLSIYSNQGGLSTDTSGNVYFSQYTTTAGQICIFKWDSAGTLQWSRSISCTGATPGDFYVSGNFMYLALRGTSGNSTVLAKLPTDGSKLGTYTAGSNTVTYSATTVATQAAASYSVAASGYTDSANTTGGWTSRANTWSSAGATLTTTAI